jgi:hypothetical protein
VFFVFENGSVSTFGNPKVDIATLQERTLFSSVMNSMQMLHSSITGDGETSARTKKKLVTAGLNVIITILWSIYTI